MPRECLRPGKRQAWTPIRPLMCGLAVPVGCRMKHAKGMFKRWLLRAGKWPWKAKKEKFHTCGGPRRRPCLGQGRGRRIYWLVVWNSFYFPYIGNNNPNWLIFFRGVETTNQYIYISNIDSISPLSDFFPRRTSGSRSRSPAAWSPLRRRRRTRRFAPRYEARNSELVERDAMRRFSSHGDWGPTIVGNPDMSYIYICIYILWYMYMYDRWINNYTRWPQRVVTSPEFLAFEMNRSNSELEVFGRMWGCVVGGRDSWIYIYNYIYIWVKDEDPKIFLLILGYFLLWNHPVFEYPISMHVHELG